jgi:GTP-binding protein
VNELRKYDEALYRKPRWLVLNKLDLVPVEQQDALVSEITRRLRWKGPVFAVSALTRRGLDALIEASWRELSAASRPAAVEDDVRFTAGPMETR